MKTQTNIAIHQQPTTVGGLRAIALALDPIQGAIRANWRKD